MRLKALREEHPWEVERAYESNALCIRGVLTPLVAAGAFAAAAFQHITPRLLARYGLDVFGGVHLASLQLARAARSRRRFRTSAR